ncbi:energy transducer TonB [uncultured Tenacibaculum sp.]|uniref:energy transducer TonB n=1 Tax=uncultured Tenacibaculum sp. TaxID=174713 RepID=UPI00261C1E18|nr:energy transducer TonB [uncultured Tenacibaculum sp.]
MKQSIFIILSFFYAITLVSQDDGYASEKKMEKPKVITINEESEDIPFTIIEEVPVHPKCHDLITNAEKKRCLNVMMIKHVQRHFNAELANCIEKKTVYNPDTEKNEIQCVGLRPGKKKIYIQFKIDITGEVVDIKVMAPHKTLEEEGVRLAKLLPKMIPGKQKGKPVKVAYTLPITFNVD